MLNKQSKQTILRQVYIFLTLLALVFIIHFSSANIYSDCSIYGTCVEATTSTGSGINYYYFNNTTLLENMFVKLDQTIPQTVINGILTFTNGIKAGTSTINSYGNILDDGDNIAIAINLENGWESRSLVNPLGNMVFSWANALYALTDLSMEGNDITTINQLCGTSGYCYTLEELNTTTGNPYLRNLSDVYGTPNQSGQMYQYNATSDKFELFTLETVYYNATSLQNVSGTYEGIINYTQHPNGQYDGITLNVTEVAGSPALDFRINFTDGIDRFNQGIIRYKTSSITGELPTMQLWDYVDSEWEDYGRLDATTGEFYTITGTVFDYMSHVQDGTVQMRLYKASNGNINNKYYVDWLAISKGYGTPTGNEVDPLSYHVGENINMYQNNITNVTMLNLTEVSGACDLSAGAGISRNSTHYCFA